MGRESDSSPIRICRVRSDRHHRSGLAARLTAVISNFAYTEATGVVVETRIPRSEGFIDLPGSCELLDQTTMRCAIGSVPPAEPTFSAAPGTRSITFTIQASDDPSGAAFRITSRVEGDQPDPQPENNQMELDARMFRTFWVTATTDSGPGSLRAAIEEASTSCTGDIPCKIAFRIDTEKPWETITLKSALPHVRGANVRVDGTTQTRFFGDLNPDGPEVELTGTRIGMAVSASSSRRPAVPSSPASRSMVSVVLES